MNPQVTVVLLEWESMEHLACQIALWHQQTEKPHVLVVDTQLDARWSAWLHSLELEGVTFLSLRGADHLSLEVALAAVQTPWVAFGHSPDREDALDRLLRGEGASGVEMFPAGADASFVRRGLVGAKRVLCDLARLEQLIGDHGGREGRMELIRLKNALVTGPKSLFEQMGAPAALRRKRQAAAPAPAVECNVPDKPRDTDLSVVIAVHNQLALTRQCIQSVRADVPDAEIIVVDNGSTDGTGEWLERGGIRAVRWGENRGVAAAWNAGLHRAQGELLCVLNNDATVRPGGLRALMAAARRTGIACVQGGVLNTKLEFVGHTSDVEESTYPDGCCLVFRRDVWVDFDETFFAYCEDTDWGLRARKLGYRWEIVPGSVDHLGSATSSGMDMGAVKERSETILKERWRGKGVGERILVRRWAALGDVVMATAALRFLRRKNPAARIELWTEPVIAEALQGIRCVDAVITEPEGEYTRTIDLDGAYEDLEIGGFCMHPALAFCQQIDRIPADAYELPDVEELEGWAEERLPGDSYVALGIRSATRSKVNWSEKGWVELVRLMPETTFVALDPHPQPCLEVKGTYTGPRLYDEPNVVDLTGQTPTARHVMALLRRCHTCVSVDTGMLHLAAGDSRRTVALVASGPGWARAPLSGDTRVIQGQAPCYPCVFSAQCPREGAHCLSHVTGQQVREALLSLWGTPAEPDGRKG